MAGRNGYGNAEPWFNTKNFLLGMLAGAVVGGLTALFLAPKSGRETREMLMRRAAETQHLVQSKVHDVKESLGKTSQSLRSKTEKETRAAGDGQ
jgi:gas vesicle protein